MDSGGDKEMPFLEHLKELRERLLKSVLAVFVLFIPAYYFSKNIFGLLMKPIVASLPEGSVLIFTRPAEGFTTYLKVSFFAALVGAFPVILYQGWKFVAPALYKEEKRVLVPFVLFGSIFFATGALFCYFIAAPPAFKFLLGEYSSDIVKPFPSIGEALSFFITLIISFGVVFEFPVITFILSRLGIVDAKMLKEKRKYAILLATIAAAVITPTTDALSMLMMLAPILVFYELGIVVAWLFGKKRLAAEEGVSPYEGENLVG
ncbi:MAG: twin-arginine translocase subunit TatC [Candidatus Methanosuratincola sp.]|jgi:sec-independent protein translocase protein TatC